MVRMVRREYWKCIFSLKISSETSCSYHFIQNWTFFISANLFWNINFQRQNGVKILPTTESMKKAIRSMMNWTMKVPTNDPSYIFHLPVIIKVFLIIPNDDFILTNKFILKWASPLNSHARWPIELTFVKNFKIHIVSPIEYIHIWNVNKCPRL